MSLHDSPMFYVVCVPKDTLRRLGWEALYHPLYSIDLATTDYHLFPPLDNKFHGKSFANVTVLLQAVIDFFAFKTPVFLPAGY